jgi:hypothetical protein
MKDRIPAIQSGASHFAGEFHAQNRLDHPLRFDLVILLSVPAQVMTERLAARTGNPSNMTHGGMDRIFADLAAVEPLLRKAADHETRTTIPFADVVRRYFPGRILPRRSRTRAARAKHWTGGQEPVNLANGRRSAA